MPLSSYVEEEEEEPCDKEAREGLGPSYVFLLCLLAAQRRTRGHAKGRVPSSLFVLGERKGRSLLLVVMHFLFCVGEQVGEQEKGKTRLFCTCSCLFLSYVEEQER